MGLVRFVDAADFAYRGFVAKNLVENIVEVVADEAAAVGQQVSPLCV